MGDLRTSWTLTDLANGLDYLDFLDRLEDKAEIARQKASAAKRGV